MTPEAPALEIAVEDDGWDAELLEAAAAEGAALAFAAAGVDPAGRSISVLATDDARMAALNAEFRGRRAPTNVLSWPAYDLAPGRPGARPPAPPARPKHLAKGEAQEIGDVALARETVAREAQERGISQRDHLRHLILHAVLHLLGYDHETDADAATMEGLESRALVEAGCADPYADEGAA